MFVRSNYLKYLYAYECFKMKDERLSRTDLMERQKALVRRFPPNYIDQYMYMNIFVYVYTHIYRCVLKYQTQIEFYFLTYVMLFGNAYV